MTKKSDRAKILRAVHIAGFKIAKDAIDDTYIMIPDYARLTANEKEVK